MLILERLFKYMFGKNFEVIKKKTKKPRKIQKKTRKKCNKIWIAREEHQGDLHGLWKKEKIVEM
jgi:hypothetical protein